MKPILSTKNLSVNFGGVIACNNLSFDLYEKEFLGLMGPNGAGKTTLVNLLTGEIKPTGGEIFFQDQNITHLPPYNIARSGIARTYQIPRPFSNLTVKDNVVVAGIYGKGLARSSAEKKADELLNLVGISEESAMYAKALQFVSLRKLELARALALEPKILFIDELAAGLSDSDLPEVLNVLKNIRSMGITVMLIEHVIKIMLGVVDRILVVDRGEKLAEGLPEEIMSNEKVISAYLGTKHAV